MRRLCRMRMGDKHHAENRGGQQWLNDRRMRAIRACSKQGQQCKTEFPALAHHHARAQRLEPALGGGLGGQGHHQRLEQQHSGQDRRDLRKMPQQQTDIEQHADGDEEQSEQYLAIRTDGRLDLMAKLGLREHHAGEKGAESERQAHGMSGPGRGQHREQHGQRKQLRGTHSRDHEEQRPQQPAAGGQHHEQRRERRCRWRRRCAAHRRPVRRRSTPRPGRETAESSGPETSRSRRPDVRACDCSPTAR